MKKIFSLLVISFFAIFIYEGVSIWSVLDGGGRDIGRIHLLDRSGNIIANLPKSEGYGTPYRGHFDYPLIQDIIQIEDKRFFSHYGIDIRSKVAALYENYKAGSTVRGGSTLTEQYIKNTYFPDAKRDIWEKINESMYAFVMEMKYSKEDILRKYLDSVYMGNGIYGVQSALDIYFWDQSIDHLSDSTIAEIITRIKYPNLAKGSEEYRSSITGKLGLKEITLPMPSREKPAYTDIFPFLTARIRSEIGEYCQRRENVLERFILKIPVDLCNTSEISLVTSIDMGLSEKASDILEGTLYPLEEKNVHNGSIYIWSEKEKKVLAYIGNRINSKENAIDMITRRRSVGSVLKPFIYYLALLQGDNPDNLILDDTRTYATEDISTTYTPENYVPKSYGPLTLREALGNSLNSATVRLSEKLGIGHIYDTFRTMGLDLDHESGYYGYGIALGAVELSLENIVTGYRGLTDISEGEKFMLFDMLSNGENRSRTFGASSILNTSIPMAVKTGTSTDFHDNWVIGYNPDIIVGVWVGNTDNQVMDDVSGVTGAGPIYHAITEELISRGYIRPTDMTPPPGIIYSYVCLDSKCVRKSANYIRDGWTRKSRPASGLYYKEDFIIDMTNEELTKWKIR